MALSTKSAAAKDRRPAQDDVRLEHRHFAFIAATLAANKPDSDWPPETSQWRLTVAAFADACSASNPRFNRERFLVACSYE